MPQFELILELNFVLQYILERDIDGYLGLNRRIIQEFVDVCLNVLIVWLLV
jgi:hypothetical protein